MVSIGQYMKPLIDFAKLRDTTIPGTKLFSKCIGSTRYKPYAHDPGEADLTHNCVYISVCADRALQSRNAT